MCNVKFVTNKEKSTVVALLKGIGTEKVYARGIAKCLESDVFNEDIGKAIALGRALKLDVSYFENAVNPTEYENGQVITFSRNDNCHRKVCYEIVNKDIYESLIITRCDFDSQSVGDAAKAKLDENCKLVIIDDSNAKY